MAVIEDATAATLRPFLVDHVEIGSTVITDGWMGYVGINKIGYVHDRRRQRAAKGRGEDPAKLLPGVHRVASLAKRWLLSTHQGAVDRAHLASYLNEFVFRFNRRAERNRGLLFLRVPELAVGHDPVRYRQLISQPRPRATAPVPPGQTGHPPSLDRPYPDRPWRHDQEMKSVDERTRCGGRAGERRWGQSVPSVGVLSRRKEGGSPMPDEDRVEVPARVSRRGFLKRVGLGAATVLVLGDGLVAYRAYDQGVLAAGRGPAFRALEDWQTYDGPLQAAAAAVLAASAHNTQPWVFAVSDGRIDLFADLRRTTGANDALDREFHISLGCALENLVLAANAVGYATEVLLDPGGESDLVARVALARAPKRSDELYDAIPGRRSNRSEYTSDQVPMETFASMLGLVDESVSPARLVFLDEDPARRQFGELLVEATRAHVADEEQSLSSFAWWRSSWDDIQRQKDGLNIDGAGLPPLVRSLGKLLPASSRATADGTFVDRTVIQSRSAAAFGVITVNDPSVLQERLAGGRLVQRLHLWASAHALGFQHMNQVTERIDRDQQQATKGVFDARLQELVGAPSLAAFRLGYPSLAALPSPRRPVDEVLR